MRLVLATANPGKVRELRDALAALGFEVVGLAAAGLAQIEETGTTLTENAVAKAVGAARASGEWALAEDSGLEVDALDGRPGVHSARFAGPAATDAENVARLLKELAHVPADRRGAQFRCVMAVANPAGEYWTAEGVCRGTIATAPRGTGGFGYDPVFVPAGEERTFAQMTLAEKRALSHREKALRALADVLGRLREGMLRGGGPLDTET